MLYTIIKNNLFYLYLIIFIYIKFSKLFKWGLGIGDWAQSPIPNPQSPIPIFLFNKKYNLFIMKIINI